MPSTISLAISLNHNTKSPIHNLNSAQHPQDCSALSELLAPSPLSKKNNLHSFTTKMQLNFITIFSSSLHIFSYATKSGVSVCVCVFFSLFVKFFHFFRILLDFFLFWVLACSHKYEGILNFLTFILFL